MHMLWVYAHFLQPLHFIAALDLVDDCVLDIVRQSDVDAQNGVGV